MERMGMLVAGVLLASGLAPVASAAIPAESARGARPAQVNRISPKTGPDEGGTRVLIKGQNFKNVRAVKFGRTRSPEFQVISPRRIVAVTPPGTGRVHVWVVKRSGALSPRESDDVFRYSGLGPAPLITNIGPGSGSRFGGETVTIDGEHLGHVTSVTFGDVESPDVDVVSDNQITAVTPAYPNGGIVDIVVTNRSGSNQRNWTYYYVPPSPAEDKFDQVECPEDGTCVALGTHRGVGEDLMSPLVSALVDGQWTSTVLPSPSGHEGEEYRLTDMSCASAAMCVAVGVVGGEHQQGVAGSAQYAEVWDGESWTPIQIPLAEGLAGVDALSVSCPSENWCQALGGRLASVWDGSSWTSSLIDVPEERSDISVGGITCPVEGWCAGAGLAKKYEANTTPGEETVVMTYVGSEWAIAPNGLGGLRYETGTFRRPVGFSRLTCPAAGTCVAIGSDQPTYTLDGGIGTYSEEEFPYVGGIGAIVCPTGALPCRVAASYRSSYYSVGGTAFLATVGDGDPVIDVVPLPGYDAEHPDGYSYINAFGCRDASRCMAAGALLVEDAASPSGASGVLVTITTSPSVAHSTTPRPSDKSGLSVEDLAFVDDSHAVVVGFYSSESGQLSPLVEIVDLP